MPQTTELEFITRKTTNKPATASIIWLHGLGADCYDFTSIITELGIPAELCVKFIFPNAPIRNITINGGFPCRAWYDIYSLTELNQEDKIGITSSEQSIVEIIAEEIKQGIPANKIVLAGFSQGGAMALYTGLRYSQPLAGIIALSCYLPMRSNAEHAFATNNHKINILQMHGSYDDVIPLKAGEATSQVLSQLTPQAQFKTFPIGHEVSLPQLQQIGQWITRILL